MLFVKEHSYITFRLKDFKPSSFIMKDIIKVGLPASMSMVIMSIGQLIFNRILIDFSTDSVAAYQVGGRIDMVIFLPIMSIAFALTTLVGMFHGAQEMDKVKYIIKYGLTRSFMITVVISIIVYACAPQLIMGFTKDIYIQNTAVKYLRLMSIVYPLVATAMPCGRILQGFGLGMPLLIITSIRVLLVSSPLAAFFIFIQGRPLEWIWYSMMISTVISSIVALTWVYWTVRKFSLIKTQT